MDKETNDALRKSIPNIAPPNLLVITRGIAGLGAEAVAEILLKVKEFSDFNEDNDPWHEHDFGSFLHQSEEPGKKIFWKIDDYAGQEGYNLVLTVMFAEEVRHVGVE